MSQGTWIVVVGGVVLFLIVGTMYWMEARRGGNTRMIRAYAILTLALLLGECGRLESRWFLVPAVVAAAVGAFDFLRIRRELMRGAQKANPEQ